MNPERGGPDRGRALGRFRISRISETERDAIVESLFYEGAEQAPYLERFFVLMIMSTSIAAFGLLQDSSAVVIGAMLVAPLMSPMLSIAAGISLGEPGRISFSAGTIAAGTALALVTGWAVSWVAAAGVITTDLPAQILARTEPTLLDLGIAVAAGATGGYVMVRKEAGAALPGVGIAVALVPPLATAGITLQLGSADLAAGALLLYLTNLACIVLAASLVFIATGFIRPGQARGTLGRTRAGVLVATLAVLAVGVPLGRHTADVFRDQAYRQEVLAAIAEWDENVFVISLNADTGSTSNSVDLLVSSPVEPNPAWELADRIDRRWPGTLELEVSVRTETTDEAVIE